MRSAAFTVAGPIQPKERPRLGRNGVVFTPSKTVKSEKRIQMAYLAQVTPENRKLRGRLKLVVTFYVDATSRARPDLDNFLKTLCDGLNKVAFDDDSQIDEIATRKIRSIQPRAECLLMELGRDKMLDEDLSSQA